MRSGPESDGWRLALMAACLLGASLLCAPSQVQAERSAPPRTGSSNHVAVKGHVSQVWIDVALKMGELVYHELADRWGVEPPEGQRRLGIVLYPNKRAFLRAMALARVRDDLDDAGGYTFRDATHSHVWLQHYGFDTRRLIVHELTHQMQNLCMPRRIRGRGPWWYREGLAEYLGHHRVTRDGITLGTIGIAVSFKENRKAAARVKGAAWDGFAVAASDRSRDYVDALALVAGLARARDPALRAAFRAFERDVVRRGAGAASFARRMAPFRKALPAALREVWAADGPRSR